MPSCKSEYSQSGGMDGDAQCKYCRDPTHWTNVCDKPECIQKENKFQADERIAAIIEKIKEGDFDDETLLRELKDLYSTKFEVEKGERFSGASKKKKKKKKKKASKKKGPKVKVTQGGGKRSSKLTRKSKQSRKAKESRKAKQPRKDKKTRRAKKAGAPGSATPIGYNPYPY